MSVLSELRVKAAKAWPFQTLPPIGWLTQAPTYADANPAVIRSALTRARRRPSGNWYVFGEFAGLLQSLGRHGGGGADRDVAGRRRGPACGSPRVPASGRGPVHRTRRVRNACVPVARSAAVGPAARRVEAVPGV